MREKKTVIRRKIIILTAPIVVQNLLSAAVSSADIVMLNYVSQSAISAVSLASQITMILFMFYFGLGTGTIVLCAQYFGKGDIRAIRMVEGIALRVAVCVSIAVSLVMFAVPQRMMQIFTNDAELIGLGASYLRIMGITYLCWGVVEVYLAVLRSIGRVRTSMGLNILAFTLNIALNAVFIFGLFGAPRMGVVGVAIATAISRVVELAGCFVVSAKSREVKLKFSYMRLRNRDLTRDFIDRAAPAVINDLIWSIGFSMYSVILGHMNNDVVAANSIATVVRNIATTFCFAVASGGGIALGNFLGAGRMEDGELCAKLSLRLTVITGLFGGVVILFLSPLVLWIADLTDTALYYLRIMLYINSYYVMGVGMNTTLIAGIFRAGGDTRFGMICDSVAMWCYAVPLAALAAFVFKLPPIAVYVLMCTDEFIKWPVVFRRYRSKIWLRNITREISESAG